MSMFKNFGSDDLEQAEDRLGGFSVLESDIYTGTVKALYAGKSKSGAINLTLIADLDGREYRETIYISNRNGEHWFTRDGKKQPLPGFTLINDLCLITTENELSELETEEKVVMAYDFDLKKEVPTNVQMVTAVLGQPVSLGIHKVLENKRELVNGEYVDTPDVREFNSIDKVFHPEAKITVAEARRGDTKGEFWNKWLDRNKGEIRDRRTIKDGQPAPGAGGPPQAGAAPKAAARPSLFSKK